MQSKTISPAARRENQIGYIVNLFFAKLLPPRAMVVGQPRVGVCDSFGFPGHAFNIGATHRDVQLVIADFGVDAVAHATRAERHATSERSGKRHASRAAESRGLRPESRAQRRLVQEHDRRWPTRKQDHVRRNWGFAERRVDDEPRRLAQLCDMGDLRA